MFVSLSDTPVALTGFDEGCALLTAIRSSFAGWYDIHECQFDLHASYGRGASAHLEWREPPTTFADALIVAPLRPFTTDVQFELRRPPTVFPIPVLILQRWTSAKHILDVGNITVASEAPVKHVAWRHASHPRALKLASSFLKEFGLPFNAAY